MRRLLKFVLIIAILSGIGYFFRPQITDFASNFISKIRGVIAPCSEPIPYVLGNFDTKFGISKTYFLSALADAEAIWEKPYGKELFTFSSESTISSDLKINLVYDYRQEATTKLASLGITVNEDKASYDKLKIKLDALEREYKSAKSEYDARAKEFDIRNEEYKRQVNSWNKKGGAPKNVYEELQAEQSWLEREAKNLNEMQDHINSIVDEINALVVVINRLANALNIVVDKYNTIGASRGESFEEGVYIQEAGSREIDIYEFSSRAKLVRVLAHELGHALGLDHIDDPKAIMYSLNQGNNGALTETDLTALKEKCGVKE